MCGEDTSLRLPDKLDIARKRTNAHEVITALQNY